MVNLNEVLSRSGISELISFLGVDTYKLLTNMEGESWSPLDLADLVIDVVGIENIFTNKKFRNVLIGSLKKTELKELAKTLDFDENTLDLYNKVKEISFSKFSQNMERLLFYFGKVPFEKNTTNFDKSTLDEIDSKYPLFKHQRQAYRDAQKILREENSNRVLIHMPTGSGKTRTTMNIVCEYLRSKNDEKDIVLWIADKEELCSQAGNEFTEAWKILGNGPINLHKFYEPFNKNSKISEIDSGFVVTSIQLLFKRKNTDIEQFLKFSERVKLVIFDEAHLITAPEYKSVLEFIAPNTNTDIIGLTATPGRSFLKDVGQDVELADFFNRKKVSLNIEGYNNPINYLQDQGFIAKIINEPITYYADANISLTKQEKEDILAGKEINFDIIKSISNDSKRMSKIITRTLEEASDPNNKILLFAPSVNQAHALTALLKRNKLKVEVVTSETNRDDRRKFIEEFKNSEDVQILVNYGVLTTGFDAPKANVAIIARPTDSIILYHQMIGRVARGKKQGGNEFCKIITVVDQRYGFRDLVESFNFWEDLWD